jgi:hypothetical protein
MFRKERCSHRHDRKSRNLCNRATDLFKDDCYFSESKTSATLGFGHADSDDAEIGKFTPKCEVDASAVLDFLEVFHRATVGEHPIGESAQFFLI